MELPRLYHGIVKKNYQNLTFQVMKSLTKFNYTEHSAELRSEQQRSWFGFGAKRPNQTAAANGSVAEWKKSHVLDAKRSTRGTAAGLFGA